MRIFSLAIPISAFYGFIKAVGSNFNNTLVFPGFKEVKLDNFYLERVKKALELGYKKGLIRAFPEGACRKTAGRTIEAEAAMCEPRQIRSIGPFTC
ncbi:MAG: hypothetical protein A2V65_04905 [Deltaproteobacteria bacterium RBG_13_49_15]|nr:MAG: hypothetical protein A2V65_04905 [Deltaproteobacteria bacterium RBG_13_49_15]